MARSFAWLYYAFCRSITQSEVSVYTVDICLRFFLLRDGHSVILELIPEPTARSAVPGVSPGRGLLISY